jgi:hypothetical protein
MKVCVCGIARLMIGDERMKRIARVSCHIEKRNE